MTSTTNPRPDTQSDDGDDWELDRVAMDAALTDLAALHVQDAARYADRLDALALLHRHAVGVILNPTGVDGGPRSARTGDTWVSQAQEAGVDLAVALRLSSGQGVGMVTDAVRLTTRFPASVQALRATVTTNSGEYLPGMTAQKLTVLDRETEHHLGSDTDALVIEQRVLRWAATDTPARFKARIKREVIRLCPDAAAQARDRAVESRRVEFSASPDGTGSLFACGLPAPYASAFDRALNDLAHRGRGDGRTHDQRRVDALLGGVLGPAAFLGEPAPLSLFDVPDDADRPTGYDLADRPRLFAGIPTGDVDTRAMVADLLDLIRQLLATLDYTMPAPPKVEVHLIRDERHGDGVTELDGHGPIDPALADELADGATHRVVWTGTDDEPIAADRGYRPSARTRRAVKARDRHCRFPGCTRPASATDIDHATAFKDAKSTSVAECELLCRLHHRIKHQTTWQLTLKGDGECVWTSPTGRVYVTYPPGNAP